MAAAGVKPKPAGPLFNATGLAPVAEDKDTWHAGGGARRRRVLLLCTGGTLTMAPSPEADGGLAPVQGALRRWLEEVEELRHPTMPEVFLHEYEPLMDSSDLGPDDWIRVAEDIHTNYLHFDGFVVVMGTDTMAFFGSALSFMLENLGKAVVLTGSQIPFMEPYNDARRNLIMAIIFASRDNISEVCIFFNDRLLRACRTTKVNTHRLSAFDSPNLPPLAQIGIGIDEAGHLALPQPKGPLRLHTNMDTRLLAVRVVPGFDGAILQKVVSSADVGLKALIVQLFGTGNIPSRSKGILDALADAAARGILVVALTQCATGSVLLGKYAVGGALKAAGVYSGGDMTLEAASAKIAYLMGRGDLTTKEIGTLLTFPLRGEVTPPHAYNVRPQAGVVHSDAVHAALANARL